MISFKAYLKEVNIDNVKGAGAVPNNQEIDYFGLRVKMKPSTFLKLALPTTSKVSDGMREYIKNGGAIGAPFLTIDVPDGMTEQPTVIGHDGRHRMMAVKELEGDNPIEVHIFLMGAISRARQITPEIRRYLNTGMYRQGMKMLVKGPLWK